MDTRRNMWKLTAIGLGVVGVTALVTGLVVANRTGVKPEARVEDPAASPATATAPAAPAATQSASSAPAPRRVAQVPDRSAIEACNRYAAQHSSAPRDRKGKVMEIVKDGAIGAVGGAAVGALGGAVAGGGKGAGKGAAIGGVLGGGGGSLYGLYDNKKHDEAYREAYATCMKQRGFSS